MDLQRHTAYHQGAPDAFFTYDVTSRQTTNIRDDDQKIEILSRVLADSLEKTQRRIEIEIFHRMQSAGIPFRLPAKRDVEDLCLSPHKDRMAWLLTYSHPRPLDAFIKRIFPSYKGRSETSLELWMSRPNGSQMKKIGVLHSDLPPESPDEERQLEWLPDGKRLSFMDKNTLWVLPAEPGR